MTNEFQMTNDEGSRLSGCRIIRHSVFVILSSFVIRH